ncbi:inactive beta-amylase 4 [Pyrus ussuriensis x Pyrus communis]|uniref:Beta-amylase n=1 Tax=Pyrus ussuriensis x Pyrus communis TaxID=2448454 RepID=A0A5N5GJE2_9ROSA|nr:inactive beta-amylase 4 [Pyrus ussuriensis x Pyrus communis]
MAVFCKCITARRSFFCFREVSFDDKPDRRNLLRNVSTFPVFKKASSLAAAYPLPETIREFPYMMPVDAFCCDGARRPRIRKIKALTVSLKALKLTCVHGIAVELHVALSFHSNVNSSSSRTGGVTLPLWIIEIGDQNKHIYYWDQNGFSNDDYLTLGVDHVPLFCGRTLSKKFELLIGTVIEEISVGLGPSGELKYPAHPLANGRWKFPGIGEFQCYDKYMMGDLKMAARKEGKPQWEEKGPQKAGCYNSLPSEVPFLGEGEESFLSDYGCFFLLRRSDSGRLLHHADDILAKAANILKKYQENMQTSIILVAKIGGIRRWHTVLNLQQDTTTLLLEMVMIMLLHFCLVMELLCMFCRILKMMDGDNPYPIWSVSKKRVHLIGRNTDERFDRVNSSFAQ